MLFNYHRIDENNAGDIHSSPLNYFEFDTPTMALEIGPSAEPLRFDGDVIVGGGGLLARTTFENRLQSLSENVQGKLISWGIGHNEYTRSAGRHIHYREKVSVRAAIRTRVMAWTGGGLVRRNRIDYGSIRDLMKRFDIHGIRDYGCGYDWVPCPSCMHPAIASYRKRAPVHDVIVYDHVDRKKLHIDGLPRMGNRAGDLDKVLAFLSSGETIVTSTYHGAYWGLLLGRKVVVVPWSSKFMGFRYPVTPCPELLGLTGCLRKARAFPEALEECQAANLRHAARVADLLGINVRPKLGASPGLTDRSFTKDVANGPR